MSDGVVKRVLAPLASLRLTVALLGMATFLVFAGTVAQIDQGIWTVVDRYFRCAFAWIGVGIFCPRDWNVPDWLGVWFPGGWLIGAALFVNLLAAHMVRFRVRGRGGRLAGGAAVIAGGIVLTAMVIGGVFNEDIAATEGDAFWRVLWRLAKGGGAAVVLMIGCQLVFGRRGGIVLIHGGIVLILVAEFVTGTTAVESRMRIEQGTPMNYVEDARSVELAITDRRDPQRDVVTVIPGSQLEPGTVVHIDGLPFDVAAVSTMQNSRLLDALKVGPQMVNPATQGSGLWAIAIEEPPVSGTDAGQTSDAPAAYIALRRRDDGADLGTWLVTPWFDRTDLERQVATIDGGAFDITLRFKRTYKPYRISLVEFRHDQYVGTKTAKNFSSVVRLEDPTRGVDRTVKIWMNNPLRYAGETFYQSSYEPGSPVTILQVVRNDGWMIPYISCMFVGVGMTVHMGAKLLAFLRRRGAA